MRQGRLGQSRRELGHPGCVASRAGAASPTSTPLRLGRLAFIPTCMSHISFSDTAAMARLMGILLLALVAPAALAAQ